MSDLRLESMPFEFEGRRYLLRCNMNVLADVQEMNGGEISPALNGKRAHKSALQFLAAMMNDYADEQGWFDPAPETGTPILEKPFTPRALGRVMNFADFPFADVMGLVIRSMTTKRGDDEAQPGGDEGN